MKYLTTCALLSFATLCLPYSHPLFLASFVVATYQRLPLTGALWASLAAGAAFDFLAADGRLGIYALAYAVATLCLYPQKQSFFPNRLTTLPLLTTLFSSLATLFYALFLKTLGRGFSLWWGWVLTDLLVMPLFDGLYCLVGVAIPLYLLFGRKAKPPPYKMERPK